MKTVLKSGVPIQFFSHITPVRKKKKKTKNRILVEKVYRRKNNKAKGIRGYLVAVSDGTTYNLGWSLCHMKLDHFNPERGMQIAMNRANDLTFRTLDAKEVPQSLHKQLFNLEIRASRYFQDQSLR